MSVGLWRNQMQSSMLAIIIMLLDCLLNNYNGYDCFCNSFAFNLYDHSSWLNKH